MDYKKLGVAIGKALERKELVASVAKFCGVSDGIAYGWIRGCRPQDKNLAGYFRLLKSLEIDVAEFADLTTPAGRLTYLRFKNELSVADLTKLCEKKAASLFFEMEAGTLKISEKQANYLAPPLNTTADYILNGDKKPYGLVELSKVEPVKSTANNEQITVQLLDFEGTRIRAQIDGGKIWFCAKDVCDVLGFVNGRDAVKNHCKPYPHVEKFYIGVVTGKKADGSDATQQVLTTFIDQSNVFRMICHSNLPKAEKFEAWVFEEVLPTINKTGGYQAENVKRVADHLSPEVLLTMKSARGFAQLAGASKREADRFVNDEMKRIYGIDAIKLVTGSQNLQLRIVK